MKISVIIPSYNHEAYLPDAIRSVLHQTHEDLELIIIDDGSTDHSVRVIETFTDKRITLHTQENQGAHAAINKGFELAEGDYIAILNSDDQFAYNRLETMVKCLQNEGADFASSWVEIIDNKGSTTGIKQAWENTPPWEFEGGSGPEEPSGSYLEHLLFSNFISTTSNMFFRRSLIDKGLRMRNFRFVHDWDFALQACREFPCIVVPEPLVKYRIHSTNTITSDIQWMNYEIMLLLAAHFHWAGDQLVRHDSKEKEVLSLQRFMDSFAFQGHERLFITLQFYIRHLKALGVINPVETLLQDETLRHTLLSSGGEILPEA